MLFSKSFLFTALAVLVPALGHSASITSVGSLSVGGYTFSNFGCSLVNDGSFATPNACSLINVNTITQPGVGIRFSSGFTAADFSFTDAVLTYNVSSNSGIDHVNLGFDGSILGDAITEVDETVYNGDTEVGFGAVSCSTDFGCSQHATITLDGTYNNLFIEKDIYVGANIGVATTSIIDQTFADAPEPSSVALMGAGALSLVVGFIRRRKATV